MEKCPVCDTEFSEGQVETCTSCGWNLKAYPRNGFEQITSVLSPSDMLLQATDWARKMWVQLKSSDADLSTTKTLLGGDHLTNSDIQSELNTLTQNNQRLESNLEQANEKNTKLQSQLVELEELKQLRTKLEQSEQKYQDNQNSLGEKQEEINQLKQRHEQLLSQLEQSAEERKRLESQIESMSKPFSPLVDLLRPALVDLLRPALVDLLRSALKEEMPKYIVSEISSTSQEQLQPLSSDSIVTDAKTAVEDEDGQQDQSKSTSPIHLISEEKDLVKRYNEDPKSFSDNVEVVSETEESINQRRLGTSKAILEKNRRGNYWILRESGCEYMVPKDKLKINEHNYNTVEALFECLDYQAGSSSNFQLVKPAKVSFLTGSEKWQLEERGILQF
jgi:myosin heavy subunit